jgi:3-isopropylmalate/(R)-2-methylmalate dehydratase small subunit
MNKFTKHIGKTVALYQANIDTDQIIPKQFLKSIERTGFGQYLFYDWRFDSDGNEKPDFVLNQPKYRDASILIAGKNFGCGSSREHAPWALEDYGFRVIIASAFADIFYNNCFKVGILPVVLSEEIVSKFVNATQDMQGYQLEVSLDTSIITDSSGLQIDFTIDNFRRYCLLNGLDDIGLTLQHESRITAFEQTRPNLL